MPDQANQSSSSSIDRRTVLRTVGAATVAGAGLTAATGTASAHGFNKVRFCGCTQVCVCGFGKIEVIIATESDDGDFTCSRTVDKGGGAPNNFCHELDCDDGLSLQLSESECDKIIAVRAFDDEEDDVFVCNPNQCAQKALDACGIRAECDRLGEMGGPCGEKFLRDECNFFPD